MAALKMGTSDPNRRKFTGNPDDFRLSLVEHLEELRTRVLRSLGVLGVGWALGWWFFEPIFEFLNRMVERSITSVVPKGLYIEKFDNLTGPFFLQLHLSFLIGVGLAFPYIVLQIWGFVAPALKPEEQRPIKQLAPVSAILFFMGVGFCWAVMPSALQWFASYLLNFNGIALMQTAGTMVFFILKMLLAFGVSFQLPLIVYMLGILNLLKAETLLKYWRHATTVIFIIAMIATPSQDPLTMLMMAIPLCILFIISVYAVRFTQRRKAAATEADDGKTYLLPGASLPSSVGTIEDEGDESFDRHDE